MEFMIIETISSNDIRLIELPELIEWIREDDFKELTHQIRTAEGKAKTGELKRKLPAFYPGFRGNERTVDGSSTATGVVQFDIDESVDKVDYDELFQLVRQLPHVIYAFRSPSNKLKFAILTDFRFDPALSVQENRKRFNIAYKHLALQMGDQLGVEFDMTSSNIGQVCYLSHDPTAFYNPDCEALELNEYCVLPNESKTFAVPISKADLDLETVESMLKFIPRNLSFADRLRVNMPILNALGSAGIGILEGHWDTKNPAKLKRSLREQLRFARPGFEPNLYRIARSYDWRPSSPWDKRKQKAKPSSHQFPALMTVEQAELVLRNEVSDFFQTGRSKILRASPGFGKTTLVLRKLATLPYQTKVVFVCPTHALADEHRKTLDGMIASFGKGKVFGQKPISTSIRGRAYHSPNGRTMCENSDALKKFSGSISAEYCVKECIYGGECTYTLQFDGFANIRFCTIEELYNAKSAFWVGIKYDEFENAEPANGEWKPDFIIIDETCLRFENDQAGKDCQFGSLKEIVRSLSDGKTLKQCIETSKAAIGADYKQLLESNELRGLRGCKILSAFQQYIIGKKTLKALEIEIRYYGGNLNLYSYRTIQSRYQGIPTLMLDATIDEYFGRLMFPDFDFITLNVKGSGNVKIHQIQNFTGARYKIEQPKILDALIRQTKLIASNYGTVGLISYKKLGMFDNFSAFLGEAIGADVVGYFNNLRGTNDFQNVDCLTIVGRHRYNEKVLLHRAEVAYGKRFSPDKIEVDNPILMADGSVMTLINTIFGMMIFRRFTTKIVNLKPNKPLADLALFSAGRRTFTFSRMKVLAQMCKSPISLISNTRISPTNF